MAKRVGEAGSSIARPRTHLYVVLDESSSMATYQAETISAVNEFVLTQQRQRVDELFASLFKFSDPHNIQLVYESVPVANVAPLTYKTYSPEGNTALRDGIAAAIAHGDKAAGQSRDRVLVVIVTDGDENMSRKVTSNEQLARMVQARRDRGNWTFVLLGANVDEQQMAADFGIVRGNVAPFMVADVGGAMQKVADALVRYRQTDDLQTDTFHNPAKRWQRPSWASTPSVVLTDDEA